MLRPAKSLPLLLLIIASLSLWLSTRAAPSASHLCRASTLDRSDSSKLPWWAQEASGTTPLNFVPNTLNHFQAYAGRNSFTFSFENGQINLKSGFDNSIKRRHHHHLFEVTFLLSSKVDTKHLKSMSAVRYFYLNDGGTCQGQESNTLPVDIDRVISVSMLTLNEY